MDAIFSSILGKVQDVEAQRVAPRCIAVQENALHDRLKDFFPIGNVAAKCRDLGIYIYIYIALGALRLNYSGNFVDQIAVNRCVNLGG